MNDILNIPSKNSYLTTKQWAEVIEYVKNKKLITDEIIEETEVDEIVEEYVVVETQHSEAYEKMIKTTSVDEMYEILLTLMNESPEKLYEITPDELQVLYDTATQMNEENPSEDYVDLVDTLQYIAGDYNLNGISVYSNTEVSDILNTELSSSESIVTFDLSKGNVIINSSTFIGFDSSGIQISGTHDSAQKYVITSSSATTNTITLNDNNLICDLTLKNVLRSNTGKGLIIGGTSAQYSNQNIKIRLEGTNVLGQLFYVGDNKLKITSASGDGSTNGSLTVNASTAWSAAIGGDDVPEHFSGLTIAGGTIIATATNGAAIGGAGNGVASISITGGNITATNNGTSATIGGGGGQTGEGGSGTVIISGGIINATNNGVGAAIGGGSSEQSNTVGNGIVKLIGGKITATANQGYAISGGYSSNSKSYASTTITISANVEYSGSINPNAVYNGTEFVFDLAKGNVEFNENSFSGKDTSENIISGTHTSLNKYFIRQSGNNTTLNQIKLIGKIVEQVNIEINGINSTIKDSISIPAHADNEKHVVLSLKGDNYINNLLYYTDNHADSLKDAQSNSTLKITSTNGDGATDGKLTVIPAKGDGTANGSIHYNAAIGGTDNQAGVAGLHIAGGTIIVSVDESNDCSAIGGGGNGYAAIKISGGYIDAENASTGATIGGGVGYTSIGSGCDIEITGGTVIAKNYGKFKEQNIQNSIWCYGVAIGGGSSYAQESDSNPSNIIITGGNITAIVPEGQTAIGAGNSNKSNAGHANVTITGGTIVCDGGLGGGSSVDGNGGDSTLNVSNSNLTVKGFIGGGATKNGSMGGNATVTIEGASTIIKAASIGGGISEKNNNASKANVTIIDGKVQAQIVMEGEGSSFNMSGGTIDNSKAISQGFNFKMINGGAIYIGTGEANMTGGTITNCTSTGYGGAIYVNGGNFIMNGGNIENNSAYSKGGAVCIVNGNVIIKSGIISNNISLDSGGAIAVTSGNVIIGTEECYNEEGTSTHIHPILESNIASNGGGIYVDGGTTTMWCGDIKHNLTYEKTVNVLVNGGNFTYNGGTIGIPYDTGVFVNGGIFEDNSSDSENLKNELHYYATLSDIVYNGKIPESKWIASPRGDILHKEDCDTLTPTWADLFPEYEFVGWEQGEATDKVVILNAIWQIKE